MNIHSLLFSMFLLFGCAAVQQNEVEVFQDNILVISKDTVTNLMTLKHKIYNHDIEDIKFIRRISSYYQVLDDKNQIFYINEEWLKKDSVLDLIMVCGTVTHYSMSIELKDDSFYVYEDVDTRVYGEKIKRKTNHVISRDLADSVFFINGKVTFNFTDNFGVGISSTNPRTILVKKDGWYSTLSDSTVIFNNINCSRYYHSLITERDGLLGLLGRVSPTYKQIGKFEYYLAKATLPNGEVRIIDVYGNAY